MVRVIKSKKKDYASYIWPVFGVLVLVIVGLSYMVANSSESQDVRSDAAKPVYTDASISIVETTPKLGDYVHFNYVLPKGIKETTNNGTQARIQTMCYQDGALVYGMAENAVDAKAGAMGEQLGGGSSQWLTNGGAANCISTLYQWTYNGYQKFNEFAKTSFDVAAR